MKFKLLLSAIVGVSAALISPAVSAYDFGQDNIYYNILSEDDATVEVTYKSIPDLFTDPTYSGEVEIPATVTNNNKEYTVKAIGQEAFYLCDRLTKVQLPNTIKVLGARAFSMNLSLASINLPEGLETIGTAAFFFCTQIQEYHIPASVTLIEDAAFYQNQSLQAFDVDPQNAVYASYDGILYNKELTQLYICPIKKTSAVLAESTLAINPSAFTGCTSLQSVTLNQSLKIIGKSAFTGCTALEEIYIPASVMSIGQYAFVSCAAMTEISVDPDNENYSAVDGVLYNHSKTELIRCPAKKATVVIEPTVTTIGEMAFTDCIYLKDVVFPESVRTVSDFAFNVNGIEHLTLNDGLETIGEAGFGSCNNLTSLYIPASVTSVGNSAFSGASVLSEVTGGLGLTVIPQHMFSYCSRLPEFSVPENVIEIGEYAFYECSSLNSISIPNDVRVIGAGAFFSCSSLEDISLPELSTIESSTFYRCYSLKEILIPNSVLSIGAKAFANSGLEKITIGENVNQIDNQAFYTSGITEVISHAVTPPTMVSSFHSTTYNSASLIVPEGTAESYKTAQNWSKFKNISEEPYSGIEDLLSDQNNQVTASVDVYSMSGSLVARNLSQAQIRTLPAGTYILHSGSTSKKISIR